MTVYWTVKDGVCGIAGKIGLSALFGMLFVHLSCTDLVAQRTSVWEMIDNSSLGFTGVWEYNDVLAAADAQNYVIIGRDSENRAARTIRRTSDGGQNWTSLLSDNSEGTEHGAMWRETWTDVAHPTPDLIIVTGYRSTYDPGVLNQSGQKHTGFYLISRDGGQNFERTDLDSNSRPSAIVMCNALEGAIVLQQIGNKNNSEPYGKPNQVLRSDDGWKTTTLMSLPDGVINSPDIVCPEPGTYITMSFNIDAGRHRVYRATDGGVQWQESAPLPPGIDGEKNFFC